jgi:hypothetical protein
MLTINQTVFANQKYGKVVEIRLGRTGKQKSVTVQFDDGTTKNFHPMMVATEGQFEPPLTGEAAYNNLREIAGIARQILKNQRKVW